MKKFIVLALALVSSVAAASEVVTVLEADLSVAPYERTSVDTRFYIDQTTGEGFAKVSVAGTRYIYQDYCDYDHYGRCFPRNRGPIPVQYPIYENTVKIEGLMLMGDKVVFHGANGDVECGTMGESRVFRIPTLYLSGKCDLQGRLSRNNRVSTLNVVLKTK